VPDNDNSFFTGATANREVSGWRGESPLDCRRLVRVVVQAHTAT